MSTKYLDDIYSSNVGLCMNITTDFETNFYLVFDKLNVDEIEFNVNKF